MQLAGTILGLHPYGEPNGSLGSLEDCYLRGTDLVAVYTQAAQRSQRTQVYWRHKEMIATTNSAEKIFGVEMVVSVQTDLLDSLPELETQTTLVAKEVLQITDLEDLTAVSLREDRTLLPDQGPCCIVLRLNDSQLSYVEMEPAQDFRELRVRHTSDQVSLRHRLFPQRLEKGVILRARVRGLFVPRGNDLQSAADFYEQFNRDALPLTT
jgi:hypothetical protein